MLLLVEWVQDLVWAVCEFNCRSTPRDFAALVVASGIHLALFVCLFPLPNVISQATPLSSSLALSAAGLDFLQTPPSPASPHLYITHFILHATLCGISKRKACSSRCQRVLGVPHSLAIRLGSAEVSKSEAGVLQSEEKLSHGSVS